MWLTISLRLENMAGGRRAKGEERLIHHRRRGVREEGFHVFLRVFAHVFFFTFTCEREKKKERDEMR